MTISEKNYLKASNTLYFIKGVISGMRLGNCGAERAIEIIDNELSLILGSLENDE